MAANQQQAENDPRGNVGADVLERLARLEAEVKHLVDLVSPLVADVHAIRLNTRHRAGFLAGVAATVSVLLASLVAVALAIWQGSPN